MAGRETIGQAWVAVTPDTEHFGREADQGVKSALGGLAKAAAGMFAAIGVKNFVGDIISAAGDMGETISKTNAIFGEQSTGLQTWAEGAAQSLGQSKQQALDAASTFAVFGKGAGLAGDDLAMFAAGLTGVASDLASFHNASPEEAIQALGAGLRGEAEPLRRFGILLDDATLRAKAMEMGLTKTTKDALTPQQKVLASQAVIMSQLGDAQGDFARTSGGLANQQRILSAEFANAKTELGERLLPIATKVTSFLAQNMGPALDFIQGIIAKVAEGIEYFIGGLQGDFTNEGSGVLLFLNQLGMKAGEIVEWFRANWPTIKATIETVLSAIGTAIAWVVDEVLPRLIAAFQVVVGWVQDNWPAIQATIATVIDWIVTYVVPAIEVAVAYIVEQFGNLVGWVEDNWPKIQETIETVINAIWTVIETVIGVIADAWGAWGDELIAIVVRVWDFIRVSIENVINFVRSIIETVMALITGDWSGAWEGIKGILSAVWEQIKAVVSGAVAVIRELLGAAWSTISGAASIAWEGIKSAAKTALDGVVGFIGELPGKLTGLLASIGSAAAEIGSTILDKIADGLKGLGEAIVAPFRSAWRAVADLWNKGPGAWSFKTPDWVPGFGGKGFDMPNLPYLHAGGVFRAALDGGEGLAVLRDGERVLSVDERARYEAGGGDRGGPLVNIERFYANDTLDVEELGRTLGYSLAAEGVAA